MLVLGIDPGLCDTGWALLSSENYTQNSTWGSVRTSPKDDIEQRLAKLFTALQKIFSTTKPDMVALENTLVGRGKADSLKLASARSIVLLTAGLDKIPVKTHAPTHIKKAITGNGQATKRQIIFMVQQTLKTDARMNTHEADAVAVALTQVYSKPSF